MPFIVINDDKGNKEQMRSNMREQMRRNYRSSGGGYHGESQSYRTEEAYREGYEHGWRDSEDEEYRRERDSRGRFM